MFDTIPDIIAHIRGKFPQLVFVGKAYSIADLIADLEEIEQNSGYEIPATAMARVFFGRDPNKVES